MKSRLTFMGCLVETFYMSEGEDETGHNRLELHLVRVSPELAREWLKFNVPNNRAKSKGKQRELATDILGGRWKHTHQGLCFVVDSDGAVLLIDGQHRLTECASTNTPILVEVSVFTRLSLRSPIDRGALRKPSFVNGLGDRKHPVSRVIYGLERGLSGFSSMGVGADTVGECYERNSNAVDTVVQAADDNAPNCRSLVRAPALAAIAFAYPLAPEQCREFATKLSSGEELKRGEAVFALRNWIAPGLSEKDIAYGTFAALKATLQGYPLTKIHTGESPYEWVCQKRRVNGIPNTPSYAVKPKRIDDAAE